MMKGEAHGGAFGKGCGKLWHRIALFTSSYIVVDLHFHFGNLNFNSGTF